MKHICTLVLLAVLMTGCGSPKVINLKYYKTCGLLNSDSCKDPNIIYEPSWGNIFWSVMLIETIVAPIYFFGYSMFNPISHK